MLLVLLPLSQPDNLHDGEAGPLTEHVLGADSQSATDVTLS